MPRKTRTDRRASTGRKASADREARPGAARRVYGLRPALEALSTRAEEIQAALVAEGRSDPRLADALARHDVVPTLRPVTELDALAEGGNHQGVVLVLGPFPYQRLEDLLRAPPERGPLVVLDQIQDPRNLGAILRSAHVLGSAGAVLPDRRSAGITPVVVRTSAGATERLPVARVTNLRRSLSAIQDAGWWLVGAVGEGGGAPETLDLVDHAALVLGSEGSGLRPSIQAACDHLVTIPMQDPLSLNVSVAAGVLLAEAARQRRAR